MWKKKVAIFPYIKICYLFVNFKVTWFHKGKRIAQNGNAIRYDPRISIYYSVDRQILQIENAIETDAGDYKIHLDDYSVEKTVNIKIIYTANTTEESKCPSNQFKCPSGHCFPKSLACDGYKHCPDGDDEVNCTGISFQCNTNQYISEFILCSGDI